jgi:glycosyltransferase involved in cell wall biosynthesis
MQLLFSLTYYTPYVSGLTLYVKRLGEALVRCGFQLSVISCQYDKNLKAEEVLNHIRVIRAIPLFRISKGFISIDWIIKSWQEVKKAEVIFVNLPQFEGVVPAFFGKIFGKKVISVYHCEVDLPPGVLNTVVERLLHLSHLITLSISDRIITYTKDFADHSKILILFRFKLEYIYPPIIVPRIDKSTQKILRQLTDKIDHVGHFVIGVAARLAAEKGMEYLFEALPQIKSKIKNQKSKIHIKNKKYMEEKAIKTPPRWQTVARAEAMTSRMVEEPKIKVVVAGSMNPVGEEKYKKKILSLVEKYKDYIVFLGELKEEEMGAFYSLLDVLVLPSVNSTEAFGMVQVEAMIAGVPVVATDLPGVRIPIQKTGMGKIVPIKDSQKLAEAIAHVLLNKEKYIKDPNSIKKEFSIEKTIGFFNNLLL